MFFFYQNVHVHHVASFMIFFKQDAIKPEVVKLNAWFGVLNSATQRFVLFWPDCLNACNRGQNNAIWRLLNFHTNFIGNGINVAHALLSTTQNLKGNCFVDKKYIQTAKFICCSVFWITCIRTNYSKACSFNTSLTIVSSFRKWMVPNYLLHEHALYMFDRTTWNCNLLMVCFYWVNRFRFKPTIEVDGNELHFKCNRSRTSMRPDCIWSTGTVSSLRAVAIGKLN